jgi:hypothetical protein
VSFDTSISFATNFGFAAGAKALFSESATFRASDVYFSSATAISAIDLKNSSLFINFLNLFGSLCNNMI